MTSSPFFIAGKVPSEFFCPRKKEVAQLKNRLLNGVNVALIAEHGTGKTALIANTLERRELRNKFQVVDVESASHNKLCGICFHLHEERF